MKTLIFISVLLMTLNTFSQEELYTYDKPITCESLNNGIYDYKLYQLINGNLYFRPENFKENTMYKLVVKEKLYYISQVLKSKVEIILKEKECEGVRIEPIDTVDSFKGKIVRD